MGVFSKKLLIAFAGALLLLKGVAAVDTGPQERYVRTYAMLAVEEMYRSGVPASITLAQGLLESRYGLSALAAEGHNHFGIKCHRDWKGKTMKVDDDLKGECFRVYDEDAESFRDHSDFLRYRDRYKFLFDIPVTDYKSWAKGLSKAGYATDPAYPSKLIRIIEENDLAKFDTATPSDFETGGRFASYSSENVTFDTPAPGPSKPSVSGKKDSKKEKAQKDRKKRRTKKTEPAPSVLPASPLSMEEASLAPKDEASEVFHFSTDRPLYKLNGVPFIYSMEDETWDSIAREYNIIRRQLLYYNDLDSPERLLPGTVVFLQAKKKQTRRGLDKYIVEADGESLRDICQRFGVRMKSVQKMNGFAPDHELRSGDTILLRK